MFWGNKELKRRLPDLIKPYDPKLLDRATYILRVGGEVYVSPTGVGNDNRLKTKKQLKPGDDFQVPAGQIALLITDESVAVPNSAVAFISIRAKYKFQGLVNISGFHVDPGFNGRLMFSVFNAGPSAVHLEFGEECFHIWYADLRDYEALPDKLGYTNIPPKYVGHIAEGIQSFSGLESKLKDIEKELSKKVTAIEQENAILKTTAAVILTIGLALIFKEPTSEDRKNTKETTQQIETRQGARAETGSEGANPNGAAPGDPAQSKQLPAADQAKPSSPPAGKPAGAQ